MTELFENAKDTLFSETGAEWVRAIAIFLVGLLLARIAGRAINRMMESRAAARQRILLRRAVVYGIVAVFTLTAMRHAGFDLSVLLGAAGILTVALGFASQTSVSNVISGLFLMGENAFSVGDTVQVDGVTGEVLSIDWLSIKLRTFDNLYVRLPNEMMLKARFTNLTRFDIRRLDLPIRIGLDADFAQVQRVLFEVADKNPLCFDEPKPLVLHKGFSDGAVDIQFSVWFAREHFFQVRSSAYAEAREALLAAGIDIAVPRRAVTVEGATTAELPPRATIEAPGETTS